MWSVIGALSLATPRLQVSTSVTCPIIRINPVIIAQAAATSAVMLDGRFVLGVGTGENLNEHVWGAHWPPVEDRLAMLREAIELMRLLWAGEVVDFKGDFYRAVNARIYTLPDAPPPIYISGFGKKAVDLAAEIGDGFITNRVDLVPRFRESTNARKPVQGGLKVCFDIDEDRAIEEAHRLWGIELLPGQLNQELQVPKLFEDALSLTRPRDIADKVACGGDPDRHLAALERYEDAGFDEVYGSRSARTSTGSSSSTRRRSSRPSAEPLQTGCSHPQPPERRRCCLAHRRNCWESARSMAQRPRRSGETSSASMWTRIPGPSFRSRGPRIRTPVCCS